LDADRLTVFRALEADRFTVFRLGAALRDLEADRFTVFRLGAALRDLEADRFLGISIMGIMPSIIGGVIGFFTTRLRDADRLTVFRALDADRFTGLTTFRDLDADRFTGLTTFRDLDEARFFGATFLVVTEVMVLFLTVFRLGLTTVEVVFRLTVRFFGVVTTFRDLEADRLTTFRLGAAFRDLEAARLTVRFLGAALTTFRDLEEDRLTVLRLVTVFFGVLTVVLRTTLRDLEVDFRLGAAFFTAVLRFPALPPIKAAVFVTRFLCFPPVTSIMGLCSP
jgi:hypothetical protein